MTDARWKHIPGWEGWYEVSNQGVVRSLDRISTAGKNKAVWYAGKILAVPTTKKGYQLVVLSKPGCRVYRYVHRLVTEAFLGKPPYGLEVCHNNGVRADNRLENLRYDTRRNNALDRKAHGTCSTGEHTRGEKNGMAKLTQQAVLEIRANPTATLAQLAGRYNVSESAIHLARVNKTWKHVHA